MFTFLLFFLFVLALLLFWFNYHRMGLVILISAILCFIGVGNGYIPAVLVNHLQASHSLLMQPQWSKENVIVVLGGGLVRQPGTINVQPSVISYSRVYEAARLYFACKASGNVCTIITSGGDPRKNKIAEAIVYRDALMALGINREDILVEDQSRNTFENAKFTSAILNKHSFAQVVLVDSGFHLSRALLYFSYFDIHATPAPSDYLAAYISLLPIGYNFAVMDFAVHEYVGIVRFYIYNFLGWNTRTQPNTSSGH